MLIYFAGPLFNKTEKEFNLALTEKLELEGFKVFLPQRDGVESDKEPYKSMDKEEKRKKMFKLDVEKILEANIFLAILDGRVPDEGVCVELGIAYCQKRLKKNNKLLVSLHTDIRAAFIGSRLNPMLKVSLDYIARTEDELIDFLKKYENQDR